MKTCKNCTTEITANTSKKVFCSSRCRVAHNRKLKRGVKIEETLTTTSESTSHDEPEPVTVLTEAVNEALEAKEEKKLNEEAFRKKIGWSPFYPLRHEPQIKIIETADKVLNEEIGYDYIVIDAGTRLGKSATCGYIVARELAKNIFDLRAGKNVKPIHIWIVAPTYDLAGKVFEYASRFFASAFPSLAGHISNRIPQSIKLPFGAKVECKSGDSPEGMLGEEIDLAIVDECSRLRRVIWESYLFQRLGSRKGKAIFISTPFGKNWFYEEWLKAKEKGTAFHFKTSDNPYYPPEKYEEAKARLPEKVFKQEHEALFLDDAASVFRRVEDVVGDCLKDVDFQSSYILGVDLGKTEDFTVITVMDRSTNQVVYWDRFNKIDYPFQKARILAIAERYNNARIIIDSTAVGTPIKDDLERAGANVDDFKFSNKSKKELIEKLSIMIEQRAIRIPKNNILIDELSSFGYKLTDSGNIIYSAPEGLHDDCVYSLGLAVWGLTPYIRPKIDLLKRQLSQKPNTPTSFI